LCLRGQHNCFMVIHTLNINMRRRYTVELDWDRGCPSYIYLKSSASNAFVSLEVAIILLEALKQLILNIARPPICVFWLPPKLLQPDRTTATIQARDSFRGRTKQVGVFFLRHSLGNWGVDLPSFVQSVPDCTRNIKSRQIIWRD
jgi:hypothetical protein